MASTYITKTMGNPPGNSKIGTFSFWFKISGLSAGGDKYIFSTYENDNNRTICKLNTDGAFEFQARSGGNLDLRYDTSRLFRDTNAWYNIVIATDTTQSTAANRVKIYVNGVQETSFSTSTIPSQNVVPHYLYGGIVRTIGAYGNGNGSNFDGSMSYLAFIDGTQELPTVFGETDATTGQWKIKTSITPSSAWGTNGYLILKDGNSVTDQSPNSNNFTVGGGTLTKTEDCPSNVFATLNPLNLQTSSPPTIIKGNNTISAIGDNDNVSTTLGGEFKWYYEAKCVQSPDGSNGYGLGVGACHIDTFNKSGWSAGNRGNFVYSEAKWYSNSLVGAGRFMQGNGNQVIASLTQATAGDIIGCACDATNGKVYIHINGTYLTSGDPVNGTGFIGGTTGKSGIWFPFFSPDGTNYGTLDINFGNGYFGTTAVSSAGTNASGNGIFEYNVPTGYTALSTKGLNL